VLSTPLCVALGIEVPIFNVGFGAAAPAGLAAAVSNAGGCGVIGSGSLPASAVQSAIGQVRSLTIRPFGVNVIIAGLADPDSAPAVERRIDLCLEQRVPLLVLFWGDPARFVERAHAAGTTLFIQVGSVDEARAAAAAGVDGVIAQGREAGGHVRGHTSIWELLPACVDALAPVPVIASGGIADGKAVARALDAGAQGVSLGTAFLAAAEANVHPEYRSRVLAATADDTVLTADLFDVGWPDAPHRTLRGKTFEEWDAAGRPPSGHRPGEGSTIGRLGDPINADVRRYAPMMTTSSFVGDVGYAPLWAGESVGAVHAVEPAADIVHRLARDASAMIEAGNSEGSRTV
jgi:NAD(P)H-dependent flavin oxidoreductase YrpB (nitropropane dioxygenase family)